MLAGPLGLLLAVKPPALRVGHHYQAGFVAGWRYSVEAPDPFVSSHFIATMRNELDRMDPSLSDNPDSMPNKGFIDGFYKAEIAKLG